MSTPYERIIEFLDDDVKRQDLKDSGVYDRRIQRALLKWHRKFMWSRDSLEEPVPFTNQNLNIQEIDLRNFTRFRFLRYVRDYDPNAINQTTEPPTQGVAGKFYAETAPETMLDYFATDKDYVMYRAGEILRLRSRFVIKNVIVGYFIDPLLNPVINISSWIAELYPDLIAAEVKVKIFGDLGKDSELKTAQMELAECADTLYSHNVRIALQ